MAGTWRAGRNRREAGGMWCHPERNGDGCQARNGPVFSPEGARFDSPGRSPGSAGPGPFARAWNVADGREARRYRADSSVMRAALSPDGKTIAGCDNSRNVILWDAATGQELRRLGGLKQRCFPVVWAPDGSWLAT